jgi:hypothetical protein
VRRREFITLLGGAAVWPLAGRAQQPKRVGVLMNDLETDARVQGFVAAFVQQLKKLGWIDGQNLHVDYRWNGGKAELARIAELLDPDCHGFMPGCWLWPVPSENSIQLTRDWRIRTSWMYGYLASGGGHYCLQLGRSCFFEIVSPLASKSQLRFPNLRGNEHD